LSDRTVCYLAAGRPALVQDTGLRRHLPIGQGLLVFDELDDAVAALAEVERDYAGHAAAAEALAARYFDSDRVLGELLDIAGV
jgi:SpoU rRNA methylase family enzyme